MQVPFPRELRKSGHKMNSFKGKFDLNNHKNDVLDALTLYVIDGLEFLQKRKKQLLSAKGEREKTIISNLYKIQTQDFSRKYKLFLSIGGKKSLLK